jgi:hypothetical protein
VHTGVEGVGGGSSIAEGDAEVRPSYSNGHARTYFLDCMHMNAHARARLFLHPNTHKYSSCGMF